MNIKTLILAAVVAIGATFSTAQPSQAHGDGVALGLGIAGFAVGAALADRYYYPPPYPYYGYYPFPRKGAGIYYWNDPFYYRPYRHYRPHKYYRKQYRHYRRHHRH